MKALLDTHAILFLAANPERLGPAARALIQNPAAQLHASLASLWEMGIKARLGKLELPVPLEIFWASTLERGRICELGIEKKAILKTMDLDMSHRDPFDRLLAAQALSSGYVFISNDAAVDAWGVKRVW